MPLTVALSTSTSCWGWASGGAGAGAGGGSRGASGGVATAGGGGLTREDPGAGAIDRRVPCCARVRGAIVAALRRGADALARTGARSLPPGATRATREFSADDDPAVSSSGADGPETSSPSDPSPPNPPDPSAITSSAASRAKGTIAAAVPARKSWRNHAPTRSITR